MNKLLKRISVLFLGIFIAIILLELGLRLIGWAYGEPDDFEISSAEDKSAYTILCIGDSHTQGYSVSPENSYPGQLQKLFNRNQAGKFNVINKGVYTQNTAQVLALLPEQIDKYKPDLIILMTGGANHWNYYGYSESPGSFLYNFKVFKLIVLLLKNISDEAAKEKNMSTELTGKYKYEIEKYKSLHTGEPDNPEHMFYIGFYKLLSLNYEEALEWFKKSIKVDPSFGNSYLFAYYCYLIYMNDAEGAIRWLESEIAMKPGIPTLYEYLGRIYHQQNRLDKSSECRRLELENKNSPDKLVFRRIESEGFNQLEQRAMQSDPRLRNLFESSTGFLIGFYGYGAGVGEEKLVEKNSSLVLDWIDKDIGNIIRTCSEKGINLMISTYAIKPELSSWTRTTGSVNSILREKAEEHSVPLVDNEAIFNGTGADMASYFKRTRNDAHPNEKGYTLMADNIYKKIEELHIFK